MTAHWLEGILYDLRFAFRGLRRDRVFTLAALAMLAIAIALNATVFTVRNALLFRGFPLVKRNDRIVYFQEHYPTDRCCISYADFEDWRSQARSFEGLAFVGGKPITLRTGDGRGIETSAAVVSANTFELLRVPPMLGRDFGPADELPGAPPVVILSARFWENWFGERADAVGSTVHVNGAPAMVIGVMPDGFDFPTQKNLWMPVAPTPELRQRGATPGGFIVFGRLRDGANTNEAGAEVATITRRLEMDYPATNRGVVSTSNGYSWLIGSGTHARLIFDSLWAGAWLVLLIACANVANLTLVRTIGRSREFSTRMALGAGAGRMARQIFMEGAMLSGLSGALAWWITKWSVKTWAIATASRYQIIDYTVDSGTLLYLIAVSVAVAVLFPLAPASRVVQLGVSGVLKGDARGVTRGKHVASMLVVVQMALAVVLLSAAGVLMRSFANIVGADTGVHDPEHVLAGLVRLPADTYSAPAMRFAYFERLEAQLKTIPGIQQEALSTRLPIGSAAPGNMEIEGRPNPPNHEESVGFLPVGPGYFGVLEAPPLAGRGFTDGDRAATPQVAIVNQSFAEKYWPGDSPIGKRIRAGEWRTIVGIVPNILQNDPLRQNFKPIVYLPLRQDAAPRSVFFLVRTSLPPENVAQVVRSAVQKLDPGVTLDNFTTLKASFAFDRDFMDADHSELGKQAAVAPIFAMIALLLAAIGLIAVIVHSVSQRTKEIGVRMAIGANKRDIRGMVLRDGMMPVATGVFAGLIVSLGVNRILQSQLVGVSPYDPQAMAGATAILILVALLGCQVPARRAMNVDPMVALRHD